MKVGELARRTGLTVRTLHHYHAVGLLMPVRRSAAGYRIYGPPEVERLQRIVLLRRLGLSLAEIRDWMDRADVAPADVIESHIERVEEECRRAQELLARLRSIRAGLESPGGVSTEVYLETIREVVDMEKYYTPEQLEKLRRRGDAMGPEGFAEVQRQWEEVFDGLRGLMEAGVGPDGEKAQELAGEALALVTAFTGGDPGIQSSLTSMYQEEGTRPITQNGMDVSPELWAYMGRAMEIARTGGS
jgi:DNA-binding transcriptional MerR regulator